jgi:NAD(P)-dependent dehydrogenase (short-subunit alcohol dehydrogenase family)
MTGKQRVAIVTGAAGGIGRAMVRGLLAADMRVAGVDRDRDPLKALAANAREQGKADDLLTIQTDLTNDSAVEEITNATPDSAVTAYGQRILVTSRRRTRVSQRSAA